MRILKFGPETDRKYYGVCESMANNKRDQNIMNFKVNVFSLLSLDIKILRFFDKIEKF